MGGAGSRVSANECDELKRGIRSVRSMLKSRSFELIRSRTSHHYHARMCLNAGDLNAANKLMPRSKCSEFLGISADLTLRSEESALNTQFCAEVKIPESSEFTSQQWMPISL